MSRSLFSAPLLLLLLGALAGVAGCDRAPPATPAPSRAKSPSGHWGPRVAPGDDAALEESSAPLFYAGPPDGKLHLYFLDLGGADAVLVQSPTGRTVLIDGGRKATGPRLLRRLSELLRQPPDLVFLTAPTDDRAGGLITVVRSLGCKEFWDVGLPGIDASYSGLLALVHARSIPLHVPDANPEDPSQLVTFDLGSGAKLSVLWPREPVQPLLPSANGDDPNALILRLDYGKTSALLMGSAAAPAEQKLLALKAPLRATLLAPGAHGSGRASTAPFLEAVHPQVAIISAGQGSELTPDESTLRELALAGAKVFRSNEVGELHATSDGSVFTVVTETPLPSEAPGVVHSFGAAAPTASASKPLPTPAPFAARKGSNYFHRARCPSVKNLPARELVTFTTRAQAARHLRPAKDCHP